MRVHVNGETIEIAPATTVAALIQQLGVGNGPVAVERNKDIVPRAAHASTALCEGDVIEVVQFVGGG